MTNKTILVTGASRGIGRSIALLFASKGWHVFLNCRNSINDLKHTARLIEETTNGTYTLVPGDVGNPDDVRAMFQKIYEECSALDVLVNNAGVAHIGLLMDMSDSEWDKVLSCDLSSVFYCCREAVPKMVGRQQGRIVNISSMWGSVGASCECAYSAAKSGIHGLTKALAKELAPSKIPVNAIACGVIDTVMNSQLNEEERAQLEEEIPAGRFADPDEVASLVWQLCQSPVYMTGQILGIDGGYI